MDLTDRMAPVAVAIIRLGRLDLEVVDTTHPAPMAVADNPMVPVEVGTGLQGLVVAASKVEEAIAFTPVVVATNLKVVLQMAVALAASTVVTVTQMGSAEVASVPI